MGRGVSTVTVETIQFNPAKTLSGTGIPQKESKADGAKPKLQPPWDEIERVANQNGEKFERLMTELRKP